jgi:hypothetical protein
MRYACYRLAGIVSADGDPLCSVECIVYRVRFQWHCKIIDVDNNRNRDCCLNNQSKSIVFDFSQSNSTIELNSTTCQHDFVPFASHFIFWINTF